MSYRKLNSYLLKDESDQMNEQIHSDSDFRDDWSDYSQMSNNTVVS